MGGGHTGRGRPRDGRPLAGCDRGEDVGGAASPHPPHRPPRRLLPATGTGRDRPGPAAIDHEVMRPALAIPSTVANLPRPPRIVTSTVREAQDADPIRPDPPVAASASRSSGGVVGPTRPESGLPAGASPFDNEPVPPSAEEIAEAAVSPPELLSPETGEPVTDPPTLRPGIQKELPVSGPFTPTLELPDEVRVRAGESTKLRVRVDRGGGSLPAGLRFAGTPEGISSPG